MVPNSLSAILNENRRLLPFDDEAGFQYRKQLHYVAGSCDTYYVRIPMVRKDASPSCSAAAVQPSSDRPYHLGVCVCEVDCRVKGNGVLSGGAGGSCQLNSALSVQKGCQIPDLGLGKISGSDTSVLQP